jgi:hypothetical protein
VDLTGYWTGLLAAVGLAVLARVLLRHPVARARAVRVAPVGLAVAAVAVLGLVFHCAAMFGPGVVAAVPGTGAAAQAVRAMGGVSLAAYAVPAVALLLAVRRVGWLPVAVLAVVLVGVGVTMYRPYPLEVHLTWLAAAVVLTTVVLTGLVAVRRPAAPA